MHHNSRMSRNALAVLHELRIGHRGAAGPVPPGNTLASIEAALRIGVDLVEVDIQRTRDGHLILLHDLLLQPSTTGHGFVRNKSLQEIRELRTVPGGQPIPALAEVLQLVKGRAGLRGPAGLMLEIKESGTAECVLEAVRNSGFQGPVYYASFLHAELRSIRRHNASAQTIALLEGVPIDASAFALEAQATHAGIGIDSLSADYVRALHGAGLAVFVWTADEPEQIALARDAGVDGIISNYPGRLAP